MKRSLTIGLSVSLFFLFLTQYLTFQHYSILKAEESRKVNHELNSASQRLKETVSQSMSATKVLAFVIEQYGVPQNFDAIARDILECHNNIDALQLTNKGVITHVYPEEGNRAAIGFDILNDSTTNKEAYKAIDRGQLFFAGPLELKQGGMAVIGRLPVYVEEEFFGFSVAIIGLPTLLGSIGIDSASRSNFNYQLSKINPITQQEEYFMPGTTDFEDEASVFVEIPDGEWKLYVSPIHDPVVEYTIWGFSIIGLVLSLLAGMLVYQWVEKPKKLKKLVEERTSQLINSQENSRVMLGRISDAFIAFDRNLCYVYVNKKAIEIFDFDPEKIIGQYVWDVFPDLKESSLYYAFSKAMSTGGYVCEEFYLANKERWLENHFYPSRDGLSLFVRDITKNKKIEARLEASEKYFRALIEYNVNAVVLVDREGKIIYQSPSAEKISGYTLSELQSMDTRELIHPEDKSKAVALFEKAVNSPMKVLHAQHRIKHKSGRYIWIEGTYINLLDDVNVKAIVYNYHDVTERVKTQMAMSHEKYLSDSIINSLPGIFYLYDRHGKFIRWNENFETVSGYSSEEVSVMHPLDFFDEPEKEILTRKIESVFNNGKDEVEAHFFTKNRIKIPYYMNGRRVRIDGKEYLIGMGIDITEKLQAEEKALAEYKEKETTLNRISDGVVSLNRKWEYTFINDAALAIHPMGRQKVLGKTLLEIHPEFKGGTFHEIFEKAMDTMAVMETESYYETMGLWLSAKAYPSEDGLTIYFRDISDQKKIEEETLTLVDNLQGRNRDLQQFSYIVSHNLRAPLSNILGLAEILGHHPESSEKYVKAMADEALRLDQVIKDINSIVAVRKADKEGIEPIKFEDELDNVKNELACDIGESKATIISDFSSVPYIDSLRSYIRSILYHLLINAIKYKLPDTPPVIKVQTAYEGEFICLSVKDNGIGIDLEKHQSRIFGLYKRFHFDETIPGRGVGLNMIKTRVESLGGRVEVESRLNEGALFRVYLPEKFKTNN